MQSALQIRVILISTVTPGPNSAGQLVLQRHLVDEPAIDLQIMPTEPRKWGLRKFMRRLMGRLGQTELLHPFCQDIMALWRGGWIDAELPAPPDTKMPAVVMTVAHEEACYAAMRYAQKYELPLVTIFHDWWPDIASVHRPFRRMLERCFRDLYSKSDLALCVSDGMKTKLGHHPSAKVLLPLPAKVEANRSNAVPGQDHLFRFLYAGNLHVYGPMLVEAMQHLKDHTRIRLEVRGNSSSWPDTVKDEMTKRGVLLPFVPRDELTEWLESADAFLITQSFDEKEHDLMMTNFPSKLPEFAQFGKPLILWGPADASGPLWARETGFALVIDKEDPAYLLQALEQLRDNTAEQKMLREAANSAASGCFNPAKIQSQFMDDLVEVAGKKRRSTD